jgi:hypothetical protein
MRSPTAGPPWSGQQPKALEARHEGEETRYFLTHIRCVYDSQAKVESDFRSFRQTPQAVSSITKNTGLLKVSGSTQPRITILFDNIGIDKTAVMTPPKAVIARSVINSVATLFSALLQRQPTQRPLVFKCVCPYRR